MARRRLLHLPNLQVTVWLPCRPRQLSSRRSSRWRQPLCWMLRLPSRCLLPSLNSQQRQRQPLSSPRVTWPWLMRPLRRRQLPLPPRQPLSRLLSPRSLLPRLTSRPRSWLLPPPARCASARACASMWMRRRLTTRPRALPAMPPSPSACARATWSRWGLPHRLTVMLATGLVGAVSMLAGFASHTLSCRQVQLPRPCLLPADHQRGRQHRGLCPVGPGHHGRQRDAAARHGGVQALPSLQCAALQCWQDARWAALCEDGCLANHVWSNQSDGEL